MPYLEKKAEIVLIDLDWGWVFSRSTATFSSLLSSCDSDSEVHCCAFVHLPSQPTHTHTTFTISGYPCASTTYTLSEKRGKTDLFSFAEGETVA